MFNLRNFFSIVMLWRLSLVSCSDGIRRQTESAATEDYCMLETFQPRCLKNEVILMKSATYGRMRIGRCIRAEEVAAFGDDPRYFGCSSDVLNILDEKCSGKRECDIRLLDISSKNINPCFFGLNVYLEVSYECISVADEERSCSVIASVLPTHVIVPALGSAQLCGTEFHPWTVEAPVGQKIRISLLDFSLSSSGQLCYGVIRDKSRKQNVSICGRGEEREKELHISTGDAVEICLNEDDHKKNNGSGKHFILKLEAVGCSDLIPPEDAWLKRSDDSIVIGCYSSRQTWHLHCEAEKWIGVFGNCSQSQEHESVIESELKVESWSYDQVLTMVAVGGLTLTICLAVLCTGIVCLRRFSAQGKKGQDYKTLSFQINSARSQQLGLSQPTQSSTASGSTENDTRVFGVHEMPTYSVFVGESDFNDIDNSTDHRNGFNDNSCARM